MARTRDDNLTWTEIDASTLPTGLAAAYADYKEAQRLAASLREAFETAFNEMAAPNLPRGRRYVFGYRFGKLSIAETDAEPAKPQRAARALSAADLFTNYRAI